VSWQRRRFFLQDFPSRFPVSWELSKLKYVKLLPAQITFMVTMRLMSRSLISSVEIHNILSLDNIGFFSEIQM
jgi:hypothetical protein